MRILFTSILLSLNFCTGLNLRAWPLPMSPNTHPTQSFAEGGVLLKGGVFYHISTNILYTGSGKLEKTGKACSHSYANLIAIGSSRIYDAKVDGAINNVGLIEQEVLGILGGVYHRHCTLVTGEGK